MVKTKEHKITINEDNTIQNNSLLNNKIKETVNISKEESKDNGASNNFYYNKKIQEKTARSKLNTVQNNNGRKPRVSKTNIL